MNCNWFAATQRTNLILKKAMRWLQHCDDSNNKILNITITNSNFYISTNRYHTEINQKWSSRNKLHGNVFFFWRSSKFLFVATIVAKLVSIEINFSEAHFFASYQINKKKTKNLKQFYCFITIIIPLAIVSDWPRSMNWFYLSFLFSDVIGSLHSKLLHVLLLDYYSSILLLFSEYWARFLQDEKKLSPFFLNLFT